MIDNRNPKLWGKPCWQFLHHLSLAYPNNPTDEDKINIKNYIIALSKIIPCSKCRLHFATNLQKYPLSEKALENKYNFVNWVKDIHNLVNHANGKKLYTYEDVIKEYENNVSYNSEIMMIVGIIIVILGLLCFIKKYK